MLSTNKVGIITNRHAPKLNQLITIQVENCKPDFIQILKVVFKMRRAGTQMHEWAHLLTSREIYMESIAGSILLAYRPIQTRLTFLLFLPK
jgi:hypothetical protein